MALPPQAPLAPGTRLGSYEIERLLDSGSIAHVYLAKDLRLDRDVAIKLIHEELARNEEWLRSFERAARSVAALNHPNVITIYDVERHGNTLYISMEYVEGETLRAKLDASPLSTRELLTFGTQVADGLAKAHADGIVHGAVKPENVMLSRDGFAKVLGFGESQLSDRSQNASASEWVTGQTPRSSARAANAYTSPEQDGGLPVDFRSDQFSLGWILYEMVVGPQAFLRERAALLDRAPRSITALNPEAPQPLGVIVERCLMKDPQDRYDSTRDLARALKAVRDSSIRMRPASPTKDLDPSCTKRCGGGDGVRFFDCAGLVFLCRSGGDNPSIHQFCPGHDRHRGRRLP